MFACSSSYYAVYPALFSLFSYGYSGFSGGSVVKNPPAKTGDGGSGIEEDPLEKEKALEKLSNSSIRAFRPFPLALIIDFLLSSIYAPR